MRALRRRRRLRPGGKLLGYRALLGALAVLAALALPAGSAKGAGRAVVGSLPGQGRTTRPRCTVPRGAGPGFDATIGLGDSGGRMCVTVGERFLVLLRAPSEQAPRWGSINPSRPGILGSAPLRILFVRGVTARIFRALRPGTVELRSARRVCPPPSATTATCDAIEVWYGTVVVEVRAGRG